MNIFNQYSYVIISVAALAASIIILWRYRVKAQAAATAVIALALLLLVGYFLLRPGADDVESVSDAVALIENGSRPTVVEFFSNFCAGCLAVRPVVDRLAAEIENEFNFVRVDIHSDAGRELRERYGFSYTPEFIVFDRSGREVWRAHTPPDTRTLQLARTG